jgi:hypothetical protein
MFLAPTQHEYVTVMKKKKGYFFRKTKKMTRNKIYVSFLLQLLLKLRPVVVRFSVTTDYTGADMLEDGRALSEKWKVTFVPTRLLLVGPSFEMSVQLVRATAA